MGILKAERIKIIIQGGHSDNPLEFSYIQKSINLVLCCLSFKKYIRFEGGIAKGAWKIHCPEFYALAGLPTQTSDDGPEVKRQLSESWEDT